METKRLITVVVLMTMVAVLWSPVMRWVGTKMGYDMDAPPPPPATQVATDQPTPTSPTTAASSSSPAPSTGAAPSMTAGGIHAVPATAPAEILIGSTKLHDPTYPLGISFSSEGAGILDVVLNSFKKEITGSEPYHFQTPYTGAEKTTRVMATRNVVVNGTMVNLDGISWDVVQNTPTRAKFSIELRDATNAPVARLHKEFEIAPRSSASEGYEVVASQSIENLTDKPIEVGMEFNGPTTPPMELDRGSDRAIVGGYNDGASVYVVHHYTEEFSGKTASRDYTKAEKHDYPLLWAGVSSVYFNAIVRPEPLDPVATNPSLSPKYIEKVWTQALNPESEGNVRQVQMTFTTGKLTVAPKQSLILPMKLFLGPKQRSLLKSPYFSSMPLSYNSTLVMTSGPCSVCTFQSLIDVLVLMLGWFHAVTRDWGLAIIMLVFVVRAILHPISKKSQVNMMKMSKFGPELERLKEKYKDDRDELNKQMLQFNKQHGAGMLLGCLPMFLQMPIWIALWSSLQSTFELRHAPFLYGFTWIKDLSQPDHLIHFATPFKLWFIPVSGLNILPLIVAGMFYLQQKLTPKPPTMTPEQEQQQKMMQWMSLLMFPLFMYGAPSGLNLYTLTSFGLGIIESKIIRKHVKEQEEAEKAGKIIVDAGKKVGVKRVKSIEVQPEKKTGGVMGWISDLQKRAEQLRDDTDKKRRDKDDDRK